MVEVNPLPNTFLNLEDLRRGCPGITPTFGGALCEAASVCLEDRSHRSGVSMKIAGALTSPSSVVSWLPTSEQTRNCYADLQFAAEFGAYGIAILVIHQLTQLTVLERSRKGTGFDYWLGQRGDERPLFQDKQRLEVSGLIRGSDREVARRLQQKLDQLERGAVPLLGFAMVVHFAAPETWVGVP